MLHARCRNDSLLLQRGYKTVQLARRQDGRWRPAELVLCDSRCMWQRSLWACPGPPAGVVQKHWALRGTPLWTRTVPAHPHMGKGMGGAAASMSTGSPASPHATTGAASPYATGAADGTISDARPLQPMRLLERCACNERSPLLSCSAGVVHDPCGQVSTFSSSYRAVVAETGAERGSRRSAGT